MSSALWRTLRLPLATFVVLGIPGGIYTARLVSDIRHEIEASALPPATPKTMRLVDKPAPARTSRAARTTDDYPPSGTAAWYDASTPETRTAEITIADEGDGNHHLIRFRHTGDGANEPAAAVVLRAGDKTKLRLDPGRYRVELLTRPVGTSYGDGEFAVRSGPIVTVVDLSRPAASYRLPPKLSIIGEYEARVSSGVMKPRRPVASAPPARPVRDEPPQNYEALVPDEPTFR